MADEEMTMVKLARQLGKATALAEHNTQQLGKVDDAVVAVHKRLDRHVVEQNAQFVRLQDKMEKNAKNSTSQHSELAGKVEDLSHIMGGCIHNHVERAVDPVLTEVKSHRRLMWSVAGVLIMFLITTLGYVLANGNPWDTAIMNHKNGAYHENGNAAVR